VQICDALLQPADGSAVTLYGQQQFAIPGGQRQDTASPDSR